jgi:uncharacterized iron-regulated membrane protein
MTQIAMIIGSIALFVAGVVAWYTLSHRRVESALERVPVESRRSSDALRRGLPDDTLQK